ncbi:hemolysin family protein [Paenibacillus endoradicis]|uniref:hemolysin family protein n=1 Tax=Paenibacillus endoradicis TaxID=2972487 RepID=UPI002159B1A3|nr:hemolysin family protein [Paenibacillus endoradicis]MCR8656383.1 hemolysin family protein [Paenibacillus endoradicis]
MILNLIVFLVLLILTAFFVATEFSIIRVRPSRVQQMVAENIKNAKAVEIVTKELDGYLSACQLGITITALGLGWLGEPTVAKVLHPLFVKLPISTEISDIIAFIIAFLFVTFLHVVFGELAPKSIAIIKSEALALKLAPPIIWFHKIAYPFIWVLNGSANALVKLMGYTLMSETDAHSEEEIRLILNDSYENGKINKSEFGFMKNIFDFDVTLARDIMVPRTDMVCVFVENSTDVNIDTIMQERYTRFPVAQGDKDNIIGLLNTKVYLFQHITKAEEHPDVTKLMQNVLSVPDTIPIRKLLTIMQRDQIHMAILLDEYGGTSGLITIEDIIEEIVGEIRDEFDSDEREEIDRIDERRFLVEGRALITDVNEMTGLDLDVGETHTIGGWLYQLQPDLDENIEWKYADATFIIRERDENRIRSIEIIVEAQEPEMSGLGHA